MKQIPDTEINVNGLDIVLRVNGKKAVDSPFYKGKKCYRYDIGLSLNGGRKFIPLEFHDSIHDYDNGGGESESDLVFMAYCALKDALCFIQFPDYELFMDNFGYDWTKKEDRAEGRRAFEGCKETYLKLGLSESNLVNTINEMTEKYNI